MELTREQAIENLRIIQDKYTWSSGAIKALNMAIQALTQEPCEDAISRKAINKLRRYNLIGGMSTVSLDDINKLPSIKLQPCDDAISRNDMLDAVGHGTTYTSLEVQKIINGLPSVNPVSCEDAISRQAAIKAIEEKAKGIKNEDTLNGLCGAIAILFDLPSVRPQERIGHWIIHPKGIYAHLVCDKCLSNAPYDCPTNYCPNCGLRMFEEQKKQCTNCNHYGKLSLECGRCDDDCSMYEPQESEDE